MSWRFGLTVEKLPNGEDYYYVRELFLDKQGNVRSWSEHPMPAQGESRKDALWDLENMLKDCKKYKAHRIKRGKL